MVARHFVERWRLQRKYFLRLHYRAGLRFGEFSLDRAERELFGVPPFLVRQAAAHVLRWFVMSVARRTGALRQGMNATHAIGSVRGYLRKAGGDTPATH
jgi:hypothetical protein